MTTTLVITQGIADDLAAMLDLENESGAVLLARIISTPQGNLRLLATRLLPVPESAYDLREPLQMDITSWGYVPALNEAERYSMVPIWLHTHPGEHSTARASKSDAGVDRQLSDVFRLRSGSEDFGSVVVSTDQWGRLRFTGHLDDGLSSTAIDRLFVVGARFALQWSDEAAAEPLPALFDRNVRAFGGHMQRVIGDLRIAIVGCGGTGSSVAEQLTRLGARRLLLVDPDVLSESNLTRVYGSRPSQVGRLKVDVLADHLMTIAPDAAIERAPSMVTREETARLLQDADVIFGCTDDNAGRIVLSRHSTFMLAPVIDCGVLLTSDDEDRIVGIHGRVTVLHPGAACLLCRNRIDVARAGSEVLNPEERTRLADEGYAPALGETEPSVVAFTTMVASTAVAELMERLAGYGPEPVPSEVLLRIHDREISTNIQVPRSRCYCHLESGKLGLGVTDQYLGMLWQA